MSGGRGARSRRIRWLAGGIAGALLGLWWLRPSPVSVSVATIDRGPVRVTITEEGTTRIRDRMVLSAPITGLWEPTVRQGGDRMAAGTLLGTVSAAPLDPAIRAEAEARVVVAEALLRDALAQVEGAQATAAAADRANARAEALIAAGAVSEEALEQAHAAAVLARQAVAATQARARAAAAQREAARSVLRRGPATALSIRVPISGVLLTWPESQRRVLAAGTPLAVIGTPGDVEVRVPVLTADVSRLRLGARADVVIGRDGAGDPTVDSTSATLPGRVVRMEPAAFSTVSALGVEEQRVPVIIAVVNRDHRLQAIGDAFRVHVAITVWEAVATVRVPVSALVREGRAWSVWVADGGRARRVALQLGERDTGFAQVRAGLAIGDAVVLYPGESMRDGVPLRLAPSR